MSLMQIHVILGGNQAEHVQSRDCSNCAIKEFFDAGELYLLLARVYIAQRGIGHEQGSLAEKDIISTTSVCLTEKSLARVS